MSIFTVTIAGVTNPIEVYGGATAASDYVGAMFGDAPTSWLALSPDDQARTLVTATRYLDQQAWQGTATFLVGVTATTLQWPRSGVVNSDGTAVDATTVPVAIVQAAFELAVLVADDPDVITEIDGGSNLQQIDAGGGVGVTYFNPTSAAFGSASRLPGILDRLVGRYLASPSGDAGSALGGYSGNGGCESHFDHEHSYKRWRPF